ncbi:MAG: tetratricopeptide repeat protein, partial [Thermoleophilia bacterium]|nr:tetratricopeptide repeat protein [Thermoleophilia bacterium]
ARTLQTFANRKPGAPVLSRVSYLRELHGDFDGAKAAMAEARQAVAGAGSFQRATLAAYDGDLLWGHGDLDGAAAAYDDALELEPQHPIATVGRARLLASDGRADEAIALLSKFVDRTPVPGAATLLGELQESTGDAAAASASFDLVRALAQLQADAGVDVDLDLALFEADHSTSTPELVARARQAAIDRPTVYGADALAWTLFRSGDVAGARVALDDSLRLGTLDPLLHFHAAAILDAAGDAAGARDHLQQAVDRNPWFSIGLQPEARALATRLGVTWPTGAAS